MRDLIGSHDLLMVTLDTLRYDVAVECLASGRTPRLAKVLPGGAWERRHTPASFTYAAHHAFFAGFLPTPVTPGPHERMFAARFDGSETSGAGTYVFDAADLPAGLAAAGYHTLCLGGVGFFNPGAPLGRVLPGLFAEAHWERAFGVTAPDCLGAQLDRLEAVIGTLPAARRCSRSSTWRPCTSRTGTTSRAPPRTASTPTPPPWNTWTACSGASSPSPPAGDGPAR